MGEAVTVADMSVENVIQQLAVYNSVENAFVGLIYEDEKSECVKIEQDRDLVVSFFSKLKEPEISIQCKSYAEFIYKEENPMRAEILLGYLEHMVKNNIIASKPVCEALLNNDNLTYSNRDIWCTVFSLVRRIIGGIDYKGCRDIFRAILDKCRIIPKSDYDTPQIQVVLNAFGKILAEFTQTFRPTAQIVTISGLSQMRPVIGHSNINACVGNWMLRNLRVPLNGPLPYDRDKSQTGLIRYILTQANTVDFLTNTLIANRKEEGKHRQSELEEQLCLHVLHLTEQQAKLSDCNSVQMNLMWHNITVHIFFFVLCAMVNFPHMLMLLYKKVERKNLHKGCARDHLMWMLMQCMFGIGKTQGLYEYVAFVRLYDQLYQDTDPLSVPDMSNNHCVASFAVASIWAYMFRKNSQSPDQRTRPRPIPHILKNQLEFLKEALNSYTTSSLSPHSIVTDFQLASVCNAYSKNEKVSSNLITQIVDTLQNVKQQTSLPQNVQCFISTEPLSVPMLDALSVHTKILLIQQIFNKIDSQAKNQSPIALSPALVETCARLLVYTEVEQTFGIKTFVATLLPAVIKAKCQSVIHALVEIATYRLTHIQPHYRMMIFSCILEEFNSVQHSQLCVRYENTAACLLLSLANIEVQQQAYRSISGKFSIVSHDSEELNRILVLTLARAINAVSDSGQAGNWCKTLLTKVFEHTPHTWSAHTLDTFPALVKDFFSQNPAKHDDKSEIQRKVESEYNRWKNALNDNDRVGHFSRQNTDRPVFLCVLWKAIIHNAPMYHAAYKILEAIGPKQLGAHLRVFCDYIASQLVLCQDRASFYKTTEAVNAMIWKFNIFTLDRFLLCLSLRTHEAKDAQVSMYAIQILLTSPKFLEMVKDFSSTAVAQHWRANNAYDTTVNSHKRHPERFFYEGILEANTIPNMGLSANLQYLPTYFDNICLRMLPVMDVVIHRLIEALKLGQKLEKPLFGILKELSQLYKYHAQPVTYLYNTLHFYYKILQDKLDVKKKLVYSILGHAERLPINVVLSHEMRNYIAGDYDWPNPADYYYNRVKRLVDEHLDDLVNIDWRFTEFSSAPAHVLYSTCGELLSLPLPGEQVGQNLLEVVFKWRHRIDNERLLSWMNAIGLIVTTLPEPYWQVLFSMIAKEIQSSDFLPGLWENRVNPFEVFNLSKCLDGDKEQHCTYMLALTHAVWHHSSIGQLVAVPKFIKEEIKPLVKTEEQFLYVCHLIGPFLYRFQQERAHSCIELTIELYEILERVDKAENDLRYIDPICDFFYHIKYMFVGDTPKVEIEKVIKNLRLNLQLRLRFIAHHTTSEESGGESNVQTAPTPTN